MTERDEQVDKLIERSSLGSPGARQLRDRTPPAQVEAVQQLAEQHRQAQIARAQQLVDLERFRANHRAARPENKKPEPPTDTEGVTTVVAALMTEAQLEPVRPGDLLGPLPARPAADDSQCDVAPPHEVQRPDQAVSLNGLDMIKRVHEINRVHEKLTADQDQQPGPDGHRRPDTAVPDPADAKVLIISVAAQLAGMHPQTLRQYDRLGLVTAGRANGGGRRYSQRDVALLREVQRLSQQEGVNLAGIKRIVALEDLVADLGQQLERPGRRRPDAAVSDPADAKVLIISVAAQLAGMHPLTLRQYDRLGLVPAGRANGGGRRYSQRDVALLREVQRLSQQEGVNLAGIKRIVALGNLVADLRQQLGLTSGSPSIEPAP